MNIKLGNRLYAAAELIGNADCIIDVGSDHAKLPVWLLLNGKINRAYAVDISSSSALKAQKTAEFYGLSEKLTAKCSDGLSGFDSNDADTIVLAGMGGETIANILENAEWLKSGKHDIIIQCMSSLDRLNSFLAKNNAYVYDEKAVTDMHRIYSVAKIRLGIDKNCGNSVLPSKKILDSELGKQYVNRLLRIAGNALKGAMQSKNISDRVKLQQEINYYNSIVSE